VSVSIDRSTLQELFDIVGDATWVEELLTLYVSDTQTRFVELESLTHAANTVEIKRLAHTMKGTSAHVGAKEMQQLCLELEQIASTGDILKIAEHTVKLHAAFDRVREDVPAALVQIGATTA